MKPTEEAKLLNATLKRMDGTNKTIPERAWFFPAAWVLTVLCLLVVFKLADRGITTPPISAVTMMIGMALGWAFLAGTASRRWRAIRPHLNRESIEKRIAELH